MFTNISTTMKNMHNHVCLQKCIKHVYLITWHYSFINYIFPSNNALNFLYPISRTQFQYKDHLSRYRITILTIRWSWHLYIETGPRVCKLNFCHNMGYIRKCRLLSLIKMDFNNLHHSYMSRTKTVNKWIFISLQTSLTHRVKCRNKSCMGNLY